ncbi:MAG: HAD family hydrolase [Bacteroidales bacterium]|nr:HAD family hydrolase [Bacteroidales bacterium]
MYKYIIFDIDGTMLDTEKAILCALQKLLKIEKNKDYSADELSFVLGIPGHIALAKLDISNIDNVNNKWNSYLREYDSYIRLYPGISSTVRNLSENGIITGIVTSKTREEYEADFVPFGMHTYFNYVVCADDTQKHKPHPEPLLKALEMANISASLTLYIGDTIYDQQCSLAAKVDFGLALWGTHDKELAAKYRFNSPIEISEIFSFCSSQKTV